MEKVSFYSKINKGAKQPILLTTRVHIAYNYDRKLHIFISYKRSGGSIVFLLAPWCVVGSKSWREELSGVANSFCGSSSMVEIQRVAVCNGLLSKKKSSV